MRIENSIKNALTNVGGQLIAVVLGFILRNVMIFKLGMEYVGVSGLFTSILMMLSLADLGIGSAIIFALYKPLAENDENEVLALMNLYKRVYRAIGCFILIAGILLTPFLGFFIDKNANVDNLNLIYILFVIFSASSYFFAYNRSLNTADQKAYRLMKIDYVFKIIEHVVTILVLLFTSNYISYLVILTVTGFIHNIWVYVKVNKFYPILKEKRRPKLKESTKKALVKNIAALVFYKIALVMVNGTDNIIMSKYINIVAVGIYSNYYMIIQNITVIIAQAIIAVSASVGNLIATESREKQYVVFNDIQFLCFWVYGFATVCLFTLLNPFMDVWLAGDKSKMFEIYILVPIILNFYMVGLQSIVSIYRESYGLFWEGRYCPLWQAILNIVISVALVKITKEVSAIFWGTVISRLLTVFWFDPYIIHKHGFKCSKKGYYNKYIQYLLVTVASTGICYFISTVINLGSILNFLSLSAICLVLPNIIFFVAFSKTDEYRYFSIVTKSMLRKLKR